MTKERANRLGIIYTFIFAVIFSLPMIYFAIQFSEDLEQNFGFIGQYIDVFIPVILIFSIYQGKYLGQKLLIEKDDEVFYHCSRTLAMVSNLSHAVTFIIFLIYYLIVGNISFGEFGFGLFLLIMPGAFIYLINSLIFLFGGLIMNGILITYNGVHPFKSAKHVFKRIFSFLLHLFIT